MSCSSVYLISANPWTTFFCLYPCRVCFHYLKDPKLFGIKVFLWENLHVLVHHYSMNRPSIDPEDSDSCVAFSAMRSIFFCQTRGEEGCRTTMRPCRCLTLSARERYDTWSDRCRCFFATWLPLVTVSLSAPCSGGQTLSCPTFPEPSSDCQQFLVQRGLPLKNKAVQDDEGWRRWRIGYGGMGQEPTVLASLKLFTETLQGFWPNSFRCESKSFDGHPPGEPPGFWLHLFYNLGFVHGWNTTSMLNMIC